MYYFETVRTPRGSRVSRVHAGDHHAPYFTEPRLTKLAARRDGKRMVRLLRQESELNEPVNAALTVFVDTVRRKMAGEDVDIRQAYDALQAAKDERATVR